MIRQHKIHGQKQWRGLTLPADRVADRAERFGGRCAPVATNASQHEDSDVHQS